MTNDARDESDIKGSLALEEGNGVVRIEGRLGTDIAELWSALTEPRRLAQWYGEVEGDLRVGGRYRARLYASGWDGTGRIVECERAQRLVVMSSETEGSNEQQTEVVLQADGTGSRVHVVQRGVPRDWVWAFGAGMQIHVEDLANHVAGRGPDARSRPRAETDARFDELEPVYKALMPEE